MTFENENDQPVVLTIAGFDPSGGAGIIADVKALLHFSCRPVAAITSLTFQNSEAVFGAIHETPESLRAQILPVIQENEIAALKIGMMPTAEIIIEVAQLIREHNLPPPVIDPVFQSSSNYELADAGAIEALKRELFPMARLITPNIPEAETLTGMKIEDEQGMREAAQKLSEIGARAVLIKGGHLPPGGSPPRVPIHAAGVVRMPTFPPEALDVLNDRGEVLEYRGEWIDAAPVRGTGCMLSSAIAACLAQRLRLTESVRVAKDYVAELIRFARNIAPDPPELSDFSLKK